MYLADKPHLYIFCLLKAALTSVQPGKPHCIFSPIAASSLSSPHISIYEKRTLVFLGQKTLLLSPGLNSWKAATCTAECATGQSPSYKLLHTITAVLTQTHTTAAFRTLLFPKLFLMLDFSPFSWQIFFWWLIKQIYHFIHLHDFHIMSTEWFCEFQASSSLQQRSWVPCWIHVSRRV